MLHSLIETARWIPGKALYSYKDTKQVESSRLGNNAVHVKMGTETLGSISLHKLTSVEDNIK